MTGSGTGTILLVLHLPHLHQVGGIAAVDGSGVNHYGMICTSKEECHTLPTLA